MAPSPKLPPPAAGSISPSPPPPTHPPKSPSNSSPTTPRPTAPPPPCKSGRPSKPSGLALALIELATLIAAPRERVFDLARSIEAHQHSAARTQERAVAGVTSGLIGLNGEVTWQARHLGTTQELTVRITAFERPSFFQDVMIRGSFKTMKHDHRFEGAAEDRKSTRLNSSHMSISYAVFCLKKKT